MSRITLRWLLAALLLVGAPVSAFAQQSSVNCMPGTPCNATTAPTTSNTGDPLWKAYGKLNANDAQIYGMFGASGVLKGNGAVPNALTSASAADIAALLSGNITGDCTLSTLSITCLKTGGVNFGTFATANAAAPPAIGGTTPAAGAFTTLKATSIAGSTQCVHADSTGALSGTGTDCGSSGGGLTATGSPASGNLTKFSGVGTLTNGDLAGDCTTASTLTVTCLKTNGVNFGAFATASNTAPPAIGGTTPNTGAFTALSATSLTLGAISGSTQCLHVNSAGLVSGTGADCGTGSGGLTATGSPATGNLAFFSGSGSLTNGNLSGDVTTSNTGATTVVKIGGVNVGTFATANAATPPAIGGTTPAAGSFTTLVGGATTLASATLSGITGSVQCLHVNSAGAISGTGSDCGTGGGGGTPGGSSGQIQYNNAGVFGGIATTGSGNVVEATSPTLVTPVLGAATATSINGNTFTAGTYTLTGSAAKTLNFTNSLTLSGTDATTMTFPATSGTVDTLNSAQTFSAAKTFPNSGIILGGSSTGVTTFASANAGASNFTVTVPAATDTVATLAATQTLTNKSIAASEVNSGTLAAAQMPALTGDVTSSAGAVATTVGKINGTSLAGLSTGILKNTTTTGVPSIAAVGDVTGLFSGTCSSSTYLRGDGSCVAPSGSGTVTTSGTPASGNLAKFSGSSVVTNGDLSGDVTTSGTLATTVVKVNGGAVPASAAVLASNSSSQLTALTLGSNLAVSSGVLGTTQAINPQTGTSYTIVSGDAGKLLTSNNASAVAVTLPQAGTTGFTTGYSFDTQNLGAGTETITPTTSTINGASSLAIQKNLGCTITSDGTNYQTSVCPALIPQTALTWSALQTFGTNISIGGVQPSGATGTGSLVFGTSPTLTTPTISGNLTTNVTGSTQCVHANSAGVLSGTGSDCGSGGSTAFSALTASTNTTAAMVVGTGASIAATGSGTITATNTTNVNGAAVPTSAGMVSTNSSNQIVAQAIVTATMVTGPTNDYAPSGFGATTGVLYLTPAAGGSTLNGLAAGSNLQSVYLVNAEAAGGADVIKLANQSGSDTTAANRFLTSATTSLGIPAGGRVLCIYLGGAVTRWSCQ